MCIYSKEAIPRFEIIKTNQLFFLLGEEQQVVHFKLSDDVTYELTCPKENFMRISSVIEQAVALLPSGKAVDFDISKLEIKNSKSFFVIISEYANAGQSEELNIYTRDNIFKNSKLLEDLFYFYKLLDYFDIHELKSDIEHRIIEFTKIATYEYEAMKTLLVLGIKFMIPSVISICFPRILGSYWQGLECNLQQRTFVDKKLVDAALPYLKDDFTKVKITGPYLRAIKKITHQKADSIFGQFLAPQTITYSMPKEIQAIFPNMKSAFWHTQRGTMDFDHYINLEVEQGENGPVLIEHFDPSVRRFGGQK